MKKILQIFKDLENNNSSIYKEKLLNENKDNQLLKDILYFVYNPYILTGISDKKISKSVRGIIYNSISNEGIYGLFEYLKNNNSGRDTDIATIQEFISTQEKDLQPLFKKIVTKSLKVGITAKTINKVFGKNFIPVFELMLAKKYEEHCHKLIDKEFIITPKLDGVRILYINGKFLTRQGQEVEGLIEIHEEIKQLPQDYVYDGELLAVNDEGLKSKDLYRKTIKLSRKDGEKRNLEFHIFDMIKVYEFKQGSSSDICKCRKEYLMLELNFKPFRYLKEVPMLYKGKDLNKIQEYLDIAISNHEEGVMVQSSDSLYECKRTDSILKVKKMQDCDLRVIGFEEGSGKYKNNLGRINISYKGNIVGVGSGFSDEMRNEVWNNKEKYLNRIAKIKYFEETKNQNDDKLSLRFPVFLEWRFDKYDESLN